LTISFSVTTDVVASTILQSVTDMTTAQTTLMNGTAVSDLTALRMYIYQHKQKLVIKSLEFVRLHSIGY